MKVLHPNSIFCYYINMKTFSRYFVFIISIFIVSEICMAEIYPETSIEKMKKRGWYMVSTFYDISGDISPDDAKERAILDFNREQTPQVRSNGDSRSRPVVRY